MNGDRTRGTAPSQRAAAPAVFAIGCLLFAGSLAPPTVLAQAGDSGPPVATVAETRFGGAPQRLRAAVGAHDLQAALAAVEEIRNATLAAGQQVAWTDAEAHAILEAASVLDFIKRPDLAAELARRAAAGTKGRMRLEAVLATWLLVRQTQTEPSLGAEAAGWDATGIELLADAERVLPPDDPVYWTIQQRVVAELSRSLPKEAVTADVSPAWLIERGVHPLIAQGLDVLRARWNPPVTAPDVLFHWMVDRGVHPAVARLIDVHLAERQWRERQLNALQATLGRLKPALQNPRVAPVWSAWWANQYGLLLQQQGRYAAATEEHRKAASLAKSLKHADPQRTAEDNLALLALRMGDYQRASRLLQSSLDYHRRGPITPALWAAEINYAKALEGDREYGQAQQQLRQLLKLPDGDPVDRANAENNLALSLFLTGDWQAAEQHWKSSRNTLAGAYPAGHPYQAEVDVNLAWLDVGRGNTASAVTRLQKAAEQIRSGRGADDPRLAEVQTYLARILTSEGETAEARRLLDQALSARSRQLEATISRLSRRDRLALTQELRVHAESSAWPGSFDTFLELAAELQIPVQQQYAAVLRWKSLLERAAERAERESQTGSSELVDQRDAIRRQLHQEYFRPVSRLARSRQAQQIAALEAALEDAERRLAELQGQVPMAPAPDPADVRRGLPVGAALVDFVQHRVYVPAKPGEVFAEQSAYIAFVSRRNGPTVRIDLGSAAELNAAVAMWRGAIEATSPEAEEASQQVARRLWQPLAAAIGDASVVQICPDADLFQVPWAAIPLAENCWLIDQVAISVVPRVVVPDESEPALAGYRKPPQLLLVGGVDYGPLSTQWPALPGTRAEMDAVAKAFAKRFPEGNIRQLTGAEATEAAVLDGLTEASHVHLATHGFYLRRGSDDAFGLQGATAALNSGLVLAPPAAEDRVGRDQFLTADELGELVVDAAPLWILSACETGLGRPQAGQGMVGLLTALDRAGARGTVASLWKVDDEATSALMTEFYRQLWEDRLDPAAALRAAQLKMRKQSDPQSSHSKYWAAFYFSAGTRD